MLSRYLLSGGQSFRRTALKFCPGFTTSATVASEQKSGPASEYPPEYPNPTSKRDFVNYPKLALRETAPPVRFLCIPESWFTFMYPKTGYTGFHAFLFTTGIYFTSQETFTCVHEFTTYLGQLYVLTAVYYLYGDKIGDFYNKTVQEEADSLNSYQEVKKNSCKHALEEMNELKKIKPAIDELTVANLDIIRLQMENAFRDRIVTAYKQVKSNLDCQVQLDNAKNTLIVKSLKDFVMKNVMSSITPELEKNALQKSINDLNSLIAKA